MSARTKAFVDVAGGALFLLGACVLLPVVLLAHVATVLAG